jgi:transposase InsO family protein
MEARLSLEPELAGLAALNATFRSNRGNASFMSSRRDIQFSSIVMRRPKTRQHGQCALARQRAIRVDQGTEFVSRDLDLWAYVKGVTLDFSRPGKPTDNAFIEAFNGRFRAECLRS